MARVTRSKKIAIAEDNTALASHVAPAPFNTPTNNPLAELINENNTMPTMEEENVDAELKGLKQAYRLAIGVTKKPKKTRGRKKAKQDVQSEESNAQVIDDAANTTIALGNAGGKNTTTDQEDVLRHDGHDGGIPGTNRQCSESSIGSLPRHLSELTLKEIHNIAEGFEDISKPVGRTTRQQRARADLAAKVISEVAVEELVQEDIQQKYLSQPTPIVRTPSPSKAAARTLEEVELEVASKEVVDSTAHDEDSFVEKITCRSPAKHVSRIEDSVEALDQLEEALEAIDQAALAEQIVSPEKQRPKSKIVREMASPKATRANPAKQPMNPKASTMRVKSTVPRETVLKRTKSAVFKPATSHTTEESKTAPPPKKAPVKRPISLLPPKEPVKSKKPATLPTKFELPGEAVARKLKEQREARQAQRESSEDNVRSVPAPRLKSTKAVTKSTFELPGEAISRRKREAHEVRLKAQEEEDRKKREFKARPVRQSLVPNMVPRDTAASRARQSKIGLENMDTGLAVAKRGSNVGAHRPSMNQTILANTSATRAPGPLPERKASTKFAGTSMTGLTMHRNVSTSDVHAQRQRAKEIYSRDMRLAEDLEREKREREAAAKRSREEAAERGRQASREWAEKARLKKMAEGDKGLGIGYGPGGQMGLRG